MKCSPLPTKVRGGRDPPREGGVLRAHAVAGVPGQCFPETGADRRAFGGPCHRGAGGDLGVMMITIYIRNERFRKEQKLLELIFFF